MCTYAFTHAWFFFLCGAFFHDLVLKLRIGMLVGMGMGLHMNDFQRTKAEC